MRFPKDAPLKKEKLDELEQRLERLGIDLSRVEEKAVTSSGPGGQKANRSKCGVQLLYRPMGVVVRCARERARSVNRFLALRELADRVEHASAPGRTPRDIAAEKKRKQKDRRKRRRALKGNGGGPRRGRR